MNWKYSLKSYSLKSQIEFRRRQVTCSKLAVKVNVVLRRNVVLDKGAKRIIMSNAHVAVTNNRELTSALADRRIGQLKSLRVASMAVARSFTFPQLHRSFFFLFSPLFFRLTHSSAILSYLISQFTTRSINCISYLHTDYLSHFNWINRDHPQPPSIYIKFNPPPLQTLSGRGKK